MGRRQSVRDGRLGVSAESELQPDRRRRRARLLVGQRHHHAVSQAARAIDLVGGRARTLRVMAGTPGHTRAALSASCPHLLRAPTSYGQAARKAWVAGTSPAMTME